MPTTSESPQPPCPPPPPVTGGDALWFGPEGREIFGWLHSPATGTARAAVLLCPPIGRELSASYASYRRVALRLADDGFIVLRFDYRGTGNSPGDPPSVGIGAWLTDIHTAAELLRATGCDQILAVGIRTGSLLLAEATRRGTTTFDGVVLWDPYSTGRAFLRSEQALYRLSLTSAPSAGATDIPGFRYSRATGQAISALQLAPLPAEGCRAVHLVLRADRPIDDAVRAKLADRLTVATATGSTDLLDVLLAHAELPLPGEDEVVAWINGRAGAESRVISSPAPRHELRLGNDHLRGIREEIRWLGSERLFGVTTRPDGELDRPWVLLLSVADEHHVGPSRLWVDLARRLAAHGFPVARFDLSGIGDSPPRPGWHQHVILAPHAHEDVASAAADLTGGRPVVLVGLCSGGDVAVRAARAGLPVNEIYAVNPSLRSAAKSAGWEEYQPGSGRFGKLKNHRLLRNAKRRAPQLTWWALDTLRIQRSTVRFLLPLADRVSDTLLVFGDEEARWLEEQGGWLLRRLQRSHRVKVQGMPELDHSAAGTEARRLLSDLIVNDLLRRYSDVGNRPAVREARIDRRVASDVPECEDTMTATSDGATAAANAAAPASSSGAKSQ